jgi:hypothetical protein
MGPRGVREVRKADLCEMRIMRYVTAEVTELSIEKISAVFSVGYRAERKS